MIKSISVFLLCLISFITGSLFNISNVKPDKQIETIIEYVEVPVGNDKIISQYLNCRKNLIEITEVYYGDINCRNKVCE